MNQYYRGLDLELDTEDWRFLNYLHYTYAAETKPYVTNLGIFDQFRDFFLRKSPNNYRNHPVFTKIAFLFSSGAHSNAEHVYKYSQISVVNDILVPHCDTRTCVISIPILPLSPVSWYQRLVVPTHRMVWNPKEYTELYSYDYRHTASLLNTSIYHGAPCNDRPRIFFQVGGFNEDFLTVVKSLKRDDIQ